MNPGLYLTSFDNNQLKVPSKARFIPSSTFVLCIKDKRVYLVSKAEYDRFTANGTDVLTLQDVLVSCNGKIRLPEAIWNSISKRIAKNSQVIMRVEKNHCEILPPNTTVDQIISKALGNKTRPA